MICNEFNHRDSAVTVKSMLESLFQFGLSQAEIAVICESTQQTIRRAATGSNVRYDQCKANDAVYLNELAARGVKKPSAVEEIFR